VAEEIDAVSAVPGLRQLLPPAVFVYDPLVNLMRAITAILLLSAAGSFACANRGMHPPDDSGSGVAGAGATPGQGGNSGAGGDGGIAGTSAQAGTGGAPTGTAGSGGTGGATGAAGTGVACDLPDGSASAGGSCGAMFNFDTGVQGATINSGSTAFKAIAQSSAFTYCGSGALAISATFTGTSGPTTKGEVLINLPGAPVDLTGKTITVHVASDPGCSTDLNLSLVLNTQAGPVYFTPAFPIRPVTNMWKTGTASVTTGATAALALSLQAISSTGYQGTIYVDEIDIR
jgi:hypothetical protein